MSLSQIVRKHTASTSSVSSVGDYSKVDTVIVEGLVVLKIVKHFYEEQMSGNPLVQGLLLGLVQDHRLEVTNCFPFPRTREEEELSSGFGLTPNQDFNVQQYQLDIQRNLRQVNIDYLPVGWYQSSYGSAFLTREFVESQFSYQIDTFDAISLIYNPQKTKQGQLSVRAYRLSPGLMKMMRDDDHTSMKIKELLLNHANLIQELPVTVRNSHLVNVFLCELDQKMQRQSLDASPFGGLHLAMGSLLEKQMKNLSNGCEQILQESSHYLNYQRQYKKYDRSLKDQKDKIAYENQQRVSRGEEPLNEDSAIDKSKLPKLPVRPSGLDPLLVTAQVKQFAGELLESVGQTYGKLLLAESVQLSDKQT